MTTTEHAELIERLEDRIRELDRRDLFGDRLELHELLSECLTALRTSRRDGWLGAAARVESRAAGIKKALGDFDKETHVSLVDLVAADDAAAEIDSLMEVAQDLRRNAPQEATDEA